MLVKFWGLTLLSALSLISHHAQASCGASFCPVNTDWTAQGVWSENNGKFDLRYEYINQNQLRAGSSTTSAKQLLNTNDEVKTRSHNIVAKYDYDFNASWGVSFSVPLVQREHSHIFNAPTGAELRQWRFTKVGDAELLGRFSLRPNDKNSIGNAGLTVGISLPTGQTNLTNEQGQLAERALQPGSGAAQWIVGGNYRLRAPSTNAIWFTQLLLKTPIIEKDNFIPGNQLSLDAGYLTQLSDYYGVMLQLNYDYKGRDSGLNSSPNSGSRSLSISPGVSVFFARDWQAYGFVQKPLTQQVNGEQLGNHWALVLGVTTKF